MKNIFGFVVIFAASSLLSLNAFAQQVAAHDAPVLKGQLAKLVRLKMDFLESDQQLVATVVYSSICQTPATFIVIKNSDPEDYSVIEAHAAQPKGQMNCEARNAVEKEIIVSEYQGSTPRLGTIRVNGMGLGTR